MEKSFPILTWSRSYSKENLIEDFLAAIIVTVTMIPTAFSYAIISDLPPEVKDSVSTPRFDKITLKASF